MDIRTKIQLQTTTILVTNNFSKTIVVVAPRVGKSKAVIDALRVSGIDTSKVLITAPYISILNSWKQEFEKWNFDFKGKLTTNVSIKNRSTEEYTHVIVDEIQELSPANIQELKKFRNVCGITGTLSNSNRQTLRQELGLQVRYEYTLANAIDDNIVADYDIEVIWCELDNTIPIIPIKVGNVTKNMTELQAYSYYTGQFNKFKMLEYGTPYFRKIKNIWANRRANFLYNLPTKQRIAENIVANTDERLLIFTQSQKMADVLCEHSYHSTSKKLDNLTKFCNGNIDKLSVCAMTNMGITIKDLNHALVVQLQSDSDTAVQRICRMLNDTTKVGIIKILCCKQTQDELWLKSALSTFNQLKIKETTWTIA